MSGFDSTGLVSSLLASLSRGRGRQARADRRAARLEGRRALRERYGANAGDIVRDQRRMTRAAHRKDHVDAVLAGTQEHPIGSGHYPGRARG